MSLSLRSDAGLTSRGLRQADRASLDVLSASPPAPDGPLPPTQPLIPPIRVTPGLSSPPEIQLPPSADDGPPPGTPVLDQPPAVPPVGIPPPGIPVPPAAGAPAADDGAPPRTVPPRPPRATPSPAAMTGPAGDGGPLCWLRDDASHPFALCKPSRFPDACRNGGGGFPDEETCCARGGAFLGGCVRPPARCWTPESNLSRTCVVAPDCVNPNGDPSKIYESEEQCCARGLAFPGGCAATQSEAREAAGGVSCFVRERFFPNRQCRESFALCSGDGNGGGFYASQSDCCAPGAAFGEGCDDPLPTECWIVDEYSPSSCRRVADRPFVCLRGFNTYDSEAACCRGSFGPAGCQA